MEETRVNAAGPTPRYYHNTHIVNDKLYLWGGDQPGLPQLHNSPEKLKLSSVVDVIQLPTGEWETVATTGNPPLGIRGYASTVMNQQILFFGGSCNHDDCRHNSLFSLSLVDFKWTKLSPTSMLQGPMLKAYCGMAGLRINGEDYLLVVGGVGPMANNRPYQTEAEYSDKGLQGFVRTNEHHYYKLSTGKWVSPSAISPGQPRYLFTMSSLNDNTVILFGGNTPNGISNTVYVGTCTESSITWQKLVPESIEVPLGHYGHASVLINEEELMIVGGVGTSDCWIFNLYTRWWKQILLPKTVTGRYDHSLSIWKQGGGKGVSVIVFGGLNKDYLPLSYPEIIELERFSGNHSQVKRVGALSLSEQPLMMIGSEYGQPIPQSYSRSPSHTPYPSPQSSSSSVPQLLHQLEVEKERHRKESSELAEANDQLREELAIISQQKKLLGIKLEHMADENQHNKRELNEKDEIDKQRPLELKE
ncbi:PREDICTED: uncharacterized protein LOC105313566 [Amphimedon queenslandica]|uniref:Uncharacterized protein n=1 Tax=Amphimedon queenslandica TaxID=400682 RepID=A0AAN0JD05_AMPQE|nr:PREDICTED: uncharacterized protein LOC105313566 [Amphimedon queenslandica]|eukprot:XP_019854864.1 PREDICTED: uncharacterized protein LOC105313566 [Amphimedon queenslandica]